MTQHPYSGPLFHIKNYYKEARKHEWLSRVLSYAERRKKSYEWFVYLRPDLILYDEVLHPATFLCKDCIYAPARSMSGLADRVSSTGVPLYCKHAKDGCHGKPPCYTVTDQMYFVPQARVGSLSAVGGMHKLNSFKSDALQNQLLEEISMFPSCGKVAEDWFTRSLGFGVS